jgi:hypothetical protein
MNSASASRIQMVPSSKWRPEGVDDDVIGQSLCISFVRQRAESGATRQTITFAAPSLGPPHSHSFPRCSLRPGRGATSARLGAAASAGASESMSVPNKLSC